MVKPKKTFTMEEEVLGAQVFENDKGTKFGIVGAGVGDSDPESYTFMQARTDLYEKAFNATYTGSIVPLHIGDELQFLREGVKVEYRVGYSDGGVTDAFLFPEGRLDEAKVAETVFGK